MERQKEMNERIVSEITLMSEEAQEIMLKQFEIQVQDWCSQHYQTFKDCSVEEINQQIYKTLTCYNLLLNLK